MSLKSTLCGAAAGLTAALAAGVARAQMGEPWQVGLQDAATPVMHEIHQFNDLLFTIIVAILAVVLALLAFVIVRFRASANPTPSKTTHNTVVEVIWTVVPIMILIVIAIPSFKLLYYQDKAVDAEMTIKAIGHQWFWTYEYPDHGGFVFDSLMIPEDELEPGQPRLLATDTNVVIPVDTTVRLLVTASDVIHSWTIPAFGVKADAIPGRLNETWMRVEEEGVYYGQCSELCGTYHGFMPITVEVVSKDAFAAWIEDAREEYARNRSGAPVRLAGTAPDGAL